MMKLPLKQRGIFIATVLAPFVVGGFTLLFNNGSAPESTTPTTSIAWTCTLEGVEYEDGTKFRTEGVNFPLITECVRGRWISRPARTAAVIAAEQAELETRTASQPAPTGGQSEPQSSTKSPIVFLNCRNSIQDCWVERANGDREYSSPYKASGTSSTPSATARFWDTYGGCWNAVVFDSSGGAPYVRASGC